VILRRSAGLCGLALLTAACTTSPDGSTLVPSTTVVRPASTPGPTQPTASTAPLLVTDGVTVTADTINVGVLGDLTGPFSGQAIDALDAGRATLVNGWQLRYAPVLDRRCGDPNDEEEFDSYRELRDELGDDFVSVFDIPTQRLTAVVCRQRVPYVPPVLDAPVG